MRLAFTGHPIPSFLFVATLVVWLALEVRQGVKRRAGATNRDSGSLNVLRVFGIVGALLAVTALRVQATAFPYSAAITALSLGCMGAGIALRWWSFHTLGRYFTFEVMTSADQPVIAGGPYRLVRHPSYLALLLILFGVGLSYGNWLSLAAVTIVPLAGFVHRIRVEEAALSAAIGDRYTAYAAGRKRLLPFIW